MADIPIFGAGQIDPAVMGSNGYDQGNSVRLAGGDPKDYWRDLYRQGYSKNPKEGLRNPYQTGNQDQARLEQQRVIQDLQRAAGGDRNSLAQQQLQQGYQGAQSQQSSLGSTMRGQSAGAAQRGIQAGQQGIQRGLAGDQQMLMAQEQQAAQAMLAQLMAQQQGQDISQAQGMAQGQLGAQGLTDAMRQFYLGGAAGMDQLATEQQNQIARAQLGFDDEQRALTNQLINAGAGATAGALGTAGSIWGGNGTQKTATHDPYGSDHG